MIINNSIRSTLRQISCENSTR